MRRISARLNSRGILEGSAQGVVGRGAITPVVVALGPPRKRVRHHPDQLVAVSPPRIPRLANEVMDEGMPLSVNDRLLNHEEQTAVPTRVRERHPAYVELSGRNQDGLLKVPDRQMKHEVRFLRVVKGVPCWTRNPLLVMYIGRNAADYFAGMPSSVGKQATWREERGAEERRRAEVVTHRDKQRKKPEKPDTPLLD